MLILVEGVPGAGKSTTARWLRDALQVQGRPVRWWFEEELGHPVHVFQDDDGLRDCIADLRNGRFEDVIQAALGCWRRFANDLRGSDTSIIVDGCLSIYLTYTLFFYDFEESAIAAYVDEVIRIISDCDPRLILLRPTDLTHNFASVCAIRGDPWSNNHITTITSSPRGKRLGLSGFDGLVEFWSAYREMTDRLFLSIPFARIVVPGAAEDWPTSRQLLTEALSIDPGSEDKSDGDLERFVGCYVDQRSGADTGYEVIAEHDVLVLSGLIGFGDRCRLVRRGTCSFGFEAFPFEVTFRAGDGARADEMTIEGSDLLFSRSGAPRVLRRVSSAANA